MPRLTKSERDSIISKYNRGQDTPGYEVIECKNGKYQVRVKKEQTKKTQPMITLPLKTQSQEDNTLQQLRERAAIIKWEEDMEKEGARLMAEQDKQREKNKRIAELPQVKAFKEQMKKRIEAANAAEEAEEQKKQIEAARAAKETKEQKKRRAQPPSQQEQTSEPHKPVGLNLKRPNLKLESFTPSTDHIPPLHLTVEIERQE